MHRFLATRGPQLSFRVKLLAMTIALGLFGATVVSLAGTVEYTRDPAGRLVGVRYGGNQVLMHTYDAAGNLRGLGPPSTGTDTDQDGLDDTWEIQFFGNLGRDGTGDFDQDGSSDLAEFLAGTNPGDAASALLLFREVVNGESTTLVRWHSVAGRTYRLQYRDRLDVGNWEDIPGDVVAGGAVAEKSESLPATGHRFYRVVLISAR